MGWVNSPDMFCAVSETVADVANGYLLDLTLAFEIYPPIEGTYCLAALPTSSSARLQYVDVYMNDLNFVTQGDVGQQQRTSKLTLRALKEISPSLPSEVKDFVILEKSLQGDGGWAQIKEILGWLINKQDGNLRLHFKQLTELKILFPPPPSQHRM